MAKKAPFYEGPRHYRERPHRYQADPDPRAPGRELVRPIQRGDRVVTKWRKSGYMVPMWIVDHVHHDGTATITCMVPERAVPAPTIRVKRTDLFVNVDLPLTASGI